MHPKRNPTLAPESRQPSKVLPPTLFLGALLLLLGLRIGMPAAALLQGGAWRWLSLPAISAGLLLNVFADRRFRERRTPVHPDATPTALVTDGVFRISRNPMYLGMVLILLGAGAGLGSLGVLLVAPAFALVLDRGFIRVEERRLAEAFGAAWQAYAARVRRWI